MKTVIFAAIAAACVSAPAFAQDAAPFTGPRAGVTLGYDNAGDEDGFAYGVTAGYDLALAPRITGGVEVSLGDTTVGDSGVEISRDLAASLRLGFVATPRVLAFGKVGYATTRIETLGVGAAFEGVRFGGGLEFAATPNTYISAEYQRTEYEQNIGGRDAAMVGVGFRF
ncbi:MAG: porin family protein [Sphingobium sp.]|jgi:outer membrane immunogenic protein|uniref:Outer membrane immunogenic protein n=1 Tax=Sphingobium xenophagum TaxID=121428 RepID=A0A249MQV1_SPHXE|nr:MULTISPECIES: porin family protein [Sphingobium]MBU0659043.1 porin family protein [Alphaproteobacteria bacterium]ASY43733.1 porin family protein [Sphingobium xenophagum]MBA4753212.1 porin family protein [Sphingobium sp.]MBS88600.1 porin family protein [Sphingobium sp.]MBU0774373.1 porin family protein [Alphaproteobacteria bacterium]|tara:strand:+ start:21100 stop:21606 length:507 start_codon:yes stop_codon:yes gene_type:complete